MKLHVLVYREAVWYVDSKERLVQVCLLRVWYTTWSIVHLLCFMCFTDCMMMPWVVWNDLIVVNNELASARKELTVA